MIENNFINVKSKILFLDELKNNNVPETSIAFIEDSAEIWTHGKFYCTNDIMSTIEIEDMCNSIFTSGYYSGSAYAAAAIGEFETVSE